MRVIDCNGTDRDACVRLANLAEGTPKRGRNARTGRLAGPDTKPGREDAKRGWTLRAVDTRKHRTDADRFLVEMPDKMDRRMTRRLANADLAEYEVLRTRREVKADQSDFEDAPERLAVARSR